MNMIGSCRGRCRPWSRGRSRQRHHHKQRFLRRDGNMSHRWTRYRHSSSRSSRGNQQDKMRLLGFSGSVEQDSAHKRDSLSQDYWFTHSLSAEEDAPSGALQAPHCNESTPSVLLPSHGLPRSWLIWQSRYPQLMSCQLWCCTPQTIPRAQTNLVRSTQVLTKRTAMDGRKHKHKHNTDMPQYPSTAPQN